MPRKYNNAVDWNRVERMYRAGILSVTEIAKEVNTSEGNIRYHAKTKGWTRDLTDKVKIEARKKMIENLANARDLRDGVVSKEENAEVVKRLTGNDDESIIEQAARTQVEVVRQHQKTLGSGHSLTMRMLNELDATTTHRGELEDMIRSTVAPRRQGAIMNAISLGSRATIMRDLATAARLWITLERQAFSIADESKSKDSVKLDEMTADQLRKEIAEDARKLGLDLSAEYGQGVVQTNGSGKVH